QKPSEDLALGVILASRRLGGKQAMIVPYFPADAILVTPTENLSLYFQDGKRRRHIQEEPDADRVADYNSSNDGSRTGQNRLHRWPAFRAGGVKPWLALVAAIMAGALLAGVYWLGRG